MNKNKEDIKDIILILDDIRASYSNDRFISERLGTAVKLLNKLKKSGTQHFWHTPTKFPTTTEVKLKKTKLK